MTSRAILGCLLAFGCGEADAAKDVSVDAGRDDDADAEVETSPSPEGGCAVVLGAGQSCPGTVDSGFDAGPSCVEQKPFSGQLTHGPMLGAVSDDGVNVWVRVDAPARFQVEY